MKITLWVCLYLPVALLTLHTIIRIIRYFYPFPMPQWMAGLIDHPLRRKFLQPPEATAIRHGIQPGMTVLEVGPGSGTYTIAAAQRIGERGKLVAIDIEPRMIERVVKKASDHGVSNIKAKVADVYQLEEPDGTFDLAFMITVISEIPEPVRALREIHRVLKPTGTLAFSELLPDPDYPLPSTVRKWASQAGFRLKEKIGNFFYYTLIFEKDYNDIQA